MVSATGVVNGYCGLIVDAVADYDDDGTVLFWPAFWGGELICTGGKTRPPFYNGGSHRVLRNRLIYSGPGTGESINPITMFHYTGAGAILRLNLLGNLVTTADQLSTVEAAEDYPDVLLKITNTPTGPQGADVTLSGEFSLAKDGIWFPADPPNTSFADNMYVERIKFSNVYGVYCKIDEPQSASHFIENIDCDGTQCDAMFELNGSAGLHVNNAYHPHGTFLRIGPNIAQNSSGVYVDFLKLDAVLITDNTRMIDCMATNRDVQIRIRGQHSHLPNVQMVRTVTLDGTVQPDIQLDISNMRPFEAAAYPMRPVRGQGCGSTPTT